MQCRISSLCVNIYYGVLHYRWMIGAELTPLPLGPAGGALRFHVLRYSRRLLCLVLVCRVSFLVPRSTLQLSPQLRS